MEQQKQKASKVSRGTPVKFPNDSLAPDTKIYLSRVQDHLKSREFFDIQHCSPSGVLQTFPQPDDVTPYYDSEDYISHSDTKKTLFQKVYFLIQRANLQYKCRLAQKHSEGNVWADYGAGAGAFVQHAQSKGIEITGFEPNPVAIQVANRKNVPVLKESQFTTGDQSYDCITLWHVFEHIPNPSGILLTLSSKLKPNGTLIIAVPNYESFDAQYYKQHWAAWDVPRHLWHFNKHSIALLAKNSGLALHQIHPLYFDAFYISLLSEKYRSGWLPLGLVIGLWSNLRALLKMNPYSSTVYILKKGF